MKRLVIDARMAGHSGIGRYLRCLLTALGEMGVPWKVALVGEPKALASYGNVFGWEVRPCDFAIYGWKERWLLNRFFNDADLAHFPHFNAPERLPRSFVWTLHDLIYLNAPEYHPFPGAGWLLKNQIRRLSRLCGGMIAVSAATRDVFGKYFPEHLSKARVIHEAADPDWAARFERPAAGPVDGEKGYALYVGSIRFHKDVQTLLAAYEKILLTRNGPASGLVLAGKLDSRFERRFGFKRWVERLSGARWAGEVSDDVLAGLYRRAACLVLPSREEGFGLPVLEAMRAGLPVIVSDIPALKEVGGDAVLSFPAGQIDSLSDLLYNVTHDPGLRSRLVAAGRERSALFSWKKAAKETAGLYAELL